MGLCRLPRIVFGRLGKRLRDGVGSLLTLAYRVTPMLAHMLARAVDVVDFRSSRNGDGAEAAGAHSLRAYRGAIVRRHGQFADLGSSVRTDCVWCRVDVTDFRLSRNGDGAAQLSSRNLEENADCRGLS